MLISPAFTPVADKFFELTTAQPYGGAALAIYQHGQPVLDIWAGEARPGESWNENTKSVVFSTSKGILSILCHHLAEIGLLDIDAPVSRYWPEFAANGKENITVAMVMRHRSGLSAPAIDLTLSDLAEITPVEAAFAKQSPIWEPDTGFLYHAQSIGHLLGKVIHNITGMRVNDYLQQIIARPLNSEIWFGIPADTESQVAQLKSDNAPIPQNLEKGSPDYWGARAMSYGAAFITDVDAMSGGYNDPRVHAMSLPGAGGITSARAIAKIYSACITETDGVRLINDETIKNAISRPNPGDNIFNHPQPHPIHSLGFIISNPLHSPTLSETTFGHDGLGGQQGFADPETGISFGYITNWIPMVADGMARHREITRTLIQTISANS